MKRLNLLILAIVVLVFSNHSFAVDTDSPVSAFEKNAAEREAYVISKLKSYFDEKKDFSRVKSTGHQKKSREITLLLKEAVLNKNTWSDDAQYYLQQFLKRPTDDTNEWPWDEVDLFYLPADVDTFEPDAVTYPNIGGKMKFWYVTHSTPDGGGTTHTTTLAFVQSMAAAFETVYNTTINTMGYPAPPDDSGFSDNGGDGKMDIYVMNCGAFGVYGYAVFEGSGSSGPSFMVMDNDYSEFTSATQTEEEAMQVTAAHEYHHTVQFGINVNADPWIMEATSTWVEDQVYDDINDNLQYLIGSGGFFNNPHLSIDSESQWYNNWILLEYMETKWGQGSVKSIWLDYMTASDSGASALINVLDDEGVTFKDSFKEFAKMNYIQDGFYRDAAEYNPVNITNTYNLGYGPGTSEVFDSGVISVNHLAAKYYKITPGASTGSGDEDTLTVYVYGQDGKQIDVVPIVTYANFTVAEATGTLDSANDGTIIIEDFNRSNIDSLVLVLVNYSSTEDGSTFNIKGGLGSEGTASNGSDNNTSTDSETTSGSSGGCFIGSLR